jgi:radical SAM protein with 4Fe4S-binding SPASM domain
MSNPIQLARPLKVTISYTHTCNLDCALCYAGCHGEKTRRELDGAFWKRFLDLRIAEGIISVLFEGGEPLLRPDFLDVVGHCADRILTRVRTNGTLIDSAVAANLKQANLGTVLVDIWGARAATHDRLTGTPGSHARSEAGVRALMAAGVPTQMLLILNRLNVGELQEWIDYAYRLGVRAIGILRLYPIGRPRRNWSDLALSLDEMTDAIAALKAPADLRIMQSWHPNDGNCCWQMAAVNAYGDSIGCTYLRELVNYGNVTEVSFLETWDHPLYRELRSGRVEASCGDCSRTQSSRGGCRATAFAFYGRWSAPDPFDSALNNGVDLRRLPEWISAREP